MCTVEVYAVSKSPNDRRVAVVTKDVPDTINEGDELPLSECQSFAPVTVERCYAAHTDYPPSVHVRTSREEIDHLCTCGWEIIRS